MAKQSADNRKSEGSTPSLAIKDSRMREEIANGMFWKIRVSLSPLFLNNAVVV